MIPKREEAIEQLKHVLMVGAEEPMTAIATSFVDMIEATRDGVCLSLVNMFREKGQPYAATLVDEWLEKAKLEGTPTS